MMARRQRRTDELGPAVPRWCVEYRPGEWPGGVREWSTAVHDWAKEHLYRRGHFAAWIEIIRNLYVVQSQSWADDRT